MEPVEATYTHQSGKEEKGILIVKINFDDAGPIAVWINREGKLKLGRFESFSNCIIRTAK